MSRAFSGQGIDGFLRCHEGLLVFLTDLSGGLVGEPRMPTLRIVPELDPTRNVSIRAFPGRILRAVDEFILQRREERFGHRIVVTLTGYSTREPTHVSSISRTWCAVVGSTLKWLRSSDRGSREPGVATTGT